MEKELHPAQFPVSLVQKLLKIFTLPGDLVLDPFLGSGTTLAACLSEGRHGVGVDISPDYVKAAKTRLKRPLDKFLEEESYTQQLAICEDSRNLLNLEKIHDFLKQHKKPGFDLFVTSPPYWDVLTAAHKKTVLSPDRHPEKYTDLETDLGNIHDYETFLTSLSEVFKGSFELLAPGKYGVVIVMDIRKKSRVYPFHSDVIQLLTEIGFSYQDLIIWNRDREYNFLRPMGYPTTFIVNKVHEFILLFRKPKKNP